MRAEALVVAEEAYPQVHFTGTHVFRQDPRLQRTDEVVQRIRPAPRHEVSCASSVLFFHGIYNTASRSAISRTSLAEAKPSRPHGNCRADFMEIGIGHSRR